MAGDHNPVTAQYSMCLDWSGYLGILLNCSVEDTTHFPSKLLFATIGVNSVVISLTKTLCCTMCSIFMRRFASSQVLLFESLLRCVIREHVHWSSRTTGFHLTSFHHGRRRQTRTGVFGSDHPPFVQVLVCPIVVIGEVSRSEIDLPKTYLVL